MESDVAILGLRHFVPIYHWLDPLLRYRLRHRDVACTPQVEETATSGNPHGAICQG